MKVSMEPVPFKVLPCDKYILKNNGNTYRKIRIRKTDEGKYFGVKTLRAEDTEAAGVDPGKHTYLPRRE